MSYLVKSKNWNNTGQVSRSSSALVIPDCHTSWWGNLWKGHKGKAC